MSLNRLFDTIEKARQTANWRAAFGEPHLVEGQTLIPVAQVGYGFGFGFGQGESTADAEQTAEPPAQGEGGGGGGGASARPLGVLVATAEGVRFQPTVDDARISLAGMAVGALFILQVALTLRAIFGRRQA